MVEECLPVPFIISSDKILECWEPQANPSENKLRAVKKCSQKQASKLGRCDSNLQSPTMNDRLTDRQGLVLGDAIASKNRLASSVDA